MSEHGILFKPEMHRAIREGRKTETRRIVKIPTWAEPGTIEEDNDGKGGLMAIYGKTGCFSAIKPRYQVGDSLYVKEAHLELFPTGEPNHWSLLRPTAWEGHGKAFYKDTLPKDEPDGPRTTWKSPLHMPKWAARTWLEVTGTRAERLQEITEEGAKAEGVQPWAFDSQQPMTTGELGADSPYRGGFAVLWDDINEEHTWKSNPWVWVYQFKLLEEA